MTTRVDAVILALRSVLQDAEQTPSVYWETRTINRWINQLPGAWTWKWRHLKLRGNTDRRVGRGDAIVHLRATIAYLEANREDVESKSWRWPVWAKRRDELKSSSVEFKRVEGPTSDTRH
jgi:hypothetical protein